MTRAIALVALLTLGGCGAIPQVSQAPQPSQPSPRSAFTEPAAPVRQCISDLDARQAEFTPLPDRYFGAGCSTVNAVRLISLRSDETDLGLTNLGPVTCALADTLAGWARFGVDRAARQYLGSPLARIETMGSYNCRNVAGTDRRSGHATGNAIDVSGFILADGQRISVLGDYYAGSPDVRAFLRVIEASACKRFGTVLGPSYNAAHQNHFHLEVSSGAFCR
ncbi:MAG: extensin family protein [Sphingomonadales bacterium]|nr:extensin family protein [Sphingomonadales bacterium]